MDAEQITREVLERIDQAIADLKFLSDGLLPNVDFQKRTALNAASVEFHLKIGKSFGTAGMILADLINAETACRMLRDSFSRNIQPSLSN